MSFIGGLSSGLDTSAIINQLMQLERRPQVALTNRKSREESARTELSEIRSEINALRTMASDLRLSSGWDRLVATSSSPEAVSVEATSASTTGSYSFQVTSVATAASVYSTQTFASTDDIVAAGGASVFRASGYEELGFESLDGSGFAEGAVSFSVVQSSAAAEINGTGIPTIPIEVDGTNDNVELEVNGFTFTVTLAHGTYDSEAELADALATAIAEDPGAAAAATASLDDDNGISLRTLEEGSANSITVLGGTALDVLGLTAAATATGVDGIVEVDGVQTAITSTAQGTAVTLPGTGAASISAVIAGPLRAGTATVAQSGFGSGSLADVVATVNSSDLGYTAAAVDTGNGYRLQLTAKETGAGSTIDIDPAIYGTTAFTVLSEGTDAELTIQGTNPFTVVSSSNTFTDLLPGVNITVNAVTQSPVTVTTERDLDTVTEKVDELVTKLNEILSRIADSTSNQPNGTRSVLQGNRDVRRAADQLRSAFVAPTEGNTFGSIGFVGIELTREGSLTFDRERFKEAFLEDPTAMTALFTDRGAGAGQPGAFDRLIQVAESAASSGDGYLFTAAQASERRIDDYGSQIEAFERRLEIREAALRRTYANLEVALGGLQQMSSHLAAQLASLGGAE